MGRHGALGLSEMLRQPGICIFEADKSLATDQSPYGVHGNESQSEIDSEDLKQCDHKSPFAEENV
jgi:hypothetical protein